MDDVLVVGEALVDIVHRLDGTCSEHPGGSPANVALGLARLGRSARLLTRIGDDDRGLAVRRHLEGSGVRIDPGSTAPGPTSSATARIDASGAATYEFAIDWDLPATIPLDAVTAVHTGSIAAFLPPGGNRVVELLERASGSLTITYDPNVRPRLMGDPVTARARVEHLVGLADVVKVSDEDLTWLAGGTDPVDVARGWLARGPAIVVVTRGGEGCVGLTRAGCVEVAAPVVDVVDTVGAGDSFMAGLIDYLAGEGLLSPDRREALRAASTREVRAMAEHAARIAAITCSRAGANPPTLADLA
ncbi:MAG: carbohydrate kinase [Actinomycetota bacterium]|nr:carbohydrate kinase [Actinomycetota bacterium]